MRIERIEIDGFGRFHDRQWPLDEGLTVLHGVNEAGKTTLLNAFRAILFGFEATRDGRTWYPPLSGGRRGGRLVLRTASGERWSVERHGDRGGAGALAVLAPNGNQGGQETLDRLLHGADRDLFNNIFAFGLGELQTFSSLSADAVRGRIYGAGAGLGGTSAVDIERRLRQELDSVFVPGGSKKPLNALLARIETLKAEIADLATQPDEHAAIHREAAALRQRAAELKEEMGDWRERAARLERSRSAAPLSAELTIVEDELSGGDATLDALPADAVAVLDRRLGELAEARATLTAIDEQIDEADVARAGLAVDERLLAAGDELAALGDERTVRSGGAARRQELQAAETRHAHAVSVQLARAGGWDEPRLLALDDSIPAVEATREFEARLADAHRALSSARDRHRRAADELAGDDATDAGDQAPPIEERIAALRQLEAVGVRRAVAMARSGASDTRRLVIVGLVPLMLVAAVAAGFALGQPLLGAGVGVTFAAAAVLLARAVFGVADLAELDAERARLLESLDLPTSTDDAALERLRDELAAERARHDLARERGAAWETRRKELTRLEREVEAASAAATEAERVWSQWLVAHGMPEDLTPEAARQVLATAGVARTAATERDHARSLLQAASRDDEDFAARVDALLERLGIAPPSDAGRRDATVAALLDQLERTRQDHRRLRELEARTEQLRAAREPAAQAVAEREAAVAAHLAALGCDGPDALRQRDEAAASRRALQARRRELRAELAGIAGGADAVAKLLEEAAASDAPAQEASLATARMEIDQLATEERDGLNRLGALEADMRRLEAADEVGMRRQELVAFEGQAAWMAREWTITSLTLRLLEATRQRYERERQPDVLRAATAHFERITGGRYARIVAQGDAGVRVETEGGESRITDELSRGTAEQLYLALRFGLIEEFARHAEPLPVVMDDILVNFDADRAERTATAIRDLATRHQVLFFTCHQPTARLLDPEGERTLTLE